MRHDCWICFHDTTLVDTQRLNTGMIGRCLYVFTRHCAHVYAYYAYDLTARVLRVWSSRYVSYGILLHCALAAKSSSHAC